MSKVSVMAWAAWVAVTGMLLTAPPAYAQTYPVKPIRVAVGFPAGGPADTMARIIGRKLTELSGQTVIVENRPGANGFLAGEYVARSAPDGYTQLFASGSMLSFTKYVYTKPLIDPDRELALVTQAVSVPQIFVAHPSLPVKTLKDLAQLAARRPGQLNFSIIGQGGLIHLGTELFKMSAGITMNNVQYKGAAPAIVDLIGGHIEAAPPPDLLQRMNKLWIASVRAPETRDLLYGIGVGAVGSSIEDFNTFRAAEGRKWSELIRKINLKLE